MPKRLLYILIGGDRNPLNASVSHILTMHFWLDFADIACLVEEIIRGMGV